MSLIEKLLTTHTLQGPYLSENRLPAQELSQALQQALPRLPAPNTVPLQSISQHLQLHLQIKAPAVNGAAPQPLNPNSPFLQPAQQVSASLSQNTLQQIQDHPLSSILDLHLLELLMLEALRHRSLRQNSDTLVPSPFAQLSYLPLEVPFYLRSQSKRRLRVQGMSFLRFRFAWEDEEEAPSGQGRQSKQSRQGQQGEQKHRALQERQP